MTEIAQRTHGAWESPAEEEPQDTVTLVEHLHADHPANMLYHVTTNALSGLGILPDDILIVRPGFPYHDGDIVIANADGEYVLRQLTGPTLAAANPAYTSIPLDATVLYLLGIDHTRLTVRRDGIDRRLTDVHGHVIREIIT